MNEHHDLASRRPQTIDAQVRWLRSLVTSEPARVLDLGCGPGLHLARFAEAGWTCTGVDIAPAAIEHARRHVAGAFVLGDVRSAPVDGEHDLVLLLFGELSTFAPDDVSVVLRRIASRLAPGGLAVVEVSTPEGVRRKGSRPPGWYSAVGGLFAAGEHVVLRESALVDDAAIERWWVVESGGAEPSSYMSTTWVLPDLDERIEDARLEIRARRGDLTGATLTDDSDFSTLVITARS